MSDFKNVQKQLEARQVPNIPADIEVTKLISYYTDLTNADHSELFLLGIENLYTANQIPESVKGFDNFFKISQFFDLKKNLINRFFDAVLGLRTLGNNAKLDQIMEEKTNSKELEPMRVRGSFEYSHTQCHYSLLIDIFNYLRPTSKELLVDIGSGFGRVGHFLALCFPSTRYLGFELVDTRVQCSKRVAHKNNFSNCEYVTQDLLSEDFAIPHANYYFFYDPLDKDDLKKFSKKMFQQQQINQDQFRIIALSGYDDYLIKHFSSLEWLRVEKVFKDDYFKETGSIFHTVTN